MKTVKSNDVQCDNGRRGKTTGLLKQDSVHSSGTESTAGELVNDGGSLKSSVSSESIDGSKIQADSTGEEAKESPIANGNVPSDSNRLDDSENKESYISLRLCAPNCEPLIVKVSKNDLVQELHQMLMENEETNHRTCFCLKFHGKVLDAYSEIGSIQDLTENSTINVVEDIYTMRQARIHVHHVRDLLKSGDGLDGFHGQECAAPSFTETLHDLAPDRKRGSSQVDCTPPEYILPDAKTPPLTLMYPQQGSSLPQCLKVLQMSSFNPPPSYRALKGDVLYVYVLTLEHKAFHITCCPNGFFVNRSTEDSFNPLPADPNLICHSLIDLLSQISSGFKRSFAVIRKKRRQRPFMDRIVCPVQNVRWIVPGAIAHVSDYLRAEDAYLQRLGFEDVMPGQTRDWNEELQVCRELPRDKVCQRTVRCCNMNKVYGDFVEACLRGVVNIVHGNVVSINPQDEPKVRMYLWNSIFFSLGFDLKDQYKVIGGDAAAFVSAKYDLSGVQAFFDVDPQGLSLLGTCVVDYRGYRITCQTVIPGVLERDQQSEPCILYGSVDFGVNVVSSEKFCELLTETAKELHILPHRVRSANGNVEWLMTAVDSKGIRGNDDRLYILDLYRFCPPDPHFILDAVVGDAAREHGFPRSHPHLLAYLRPELVSSYVKSKAAQFIDIISESLQQPLKAISTCSSDESRYSWIFFPRDGAQVTITDMINCIANAQRAIDGHIDQSKIKITELNENGAEEEEEIAQSNQNALKETGETSEVDDTTETIKSNKTGEIKMQIAITENGDAEQCCDEQPKRNDQDDADSCDLVKQNNGWDNILRSAAEAVHSIRTTEFDIRFNLDIYSKVCEQVADPDEIDRQKKLLADIGHYLIGTQIPQFITDSAEHTEVIIDSRTLTKALHNRGISIRYLGLLTEMLHGKAKLDYLEKLCLMDIVSRCAKHHFRKYIIDVEHMSTSAALAHFLNCYLTADMAPLVATETRRKVKRKGRPARVLPPANSGNNDWKRLSSAGLWQFIVDEAKGYFSFSLTHNSMDEFCSIVGVQKVSLLRSICIMTGIQVKLTEYDFSTGSFTEECIMGLEPIAYRLDIDCPDGKAAYDFAIRRMEAGSIKAGLDKLSEAMSLYSTAYGQIHPVIIKCLRMSAKAYFCIGDYANALNNQHKTVQIMERWFGVDDANLIPDYITLAVYCFVAGKLSSAFNLLYRCRYLVLLLYGEQHPLTFLIDVNVAVLLYSVSEFDSSLEFLQSALKLSKHYYGMNSFKTGLIYHLMSSTNTCRGDFRLALYNERNAYTIYKAVLGETNPKTVASNECLNELTDRAVNLQRKMNSLKGSGSSISDILPTQAPSPDPSSVIEMLTLTNSLQWVFHQ